MENFAGALYRSKSLLTAVLGEVERPAENYDCRLRKRLNYGLSLEGHEEDIRDLFYRFMDTLPMQGYQCNDLDVRLPDAPCEKMEIVFDVRMIRIIIPIVESPEINLNTHYCDYDLGTLILKCCILFTRRQIDRSVQK